MPATFDKITERDWIPRYKKCCCVYTLHTGTLLIAWTITLISAGFAAIKAFAAPIILSYQDKKIQEVEELSKYLQAMKMANQSLEIPEYMVKFDPDYEMMVARLKISTVFVIVGIMFVVNVLLLIAIHKKTFSLMLPWLLSNFVVMILGIYGAVKYFSWGFSSSDTFLLYGAGVGSLVLLGYFYLVVYSYFRDLKDVYYKSEDNFNKLHEEEEGTDLGLEGTDRRRT